MIVAAISTSLLAIDEATVSEFVLPILPLAAAAFETPVTAVAESF